VEIFLRLNKNDKIIKWIVFLPLVSIAITTGLLIFMFIKFENDAYKDALESAKSNYLKESKIKARERIEQISSFLETNEKLLREEARSEVKTLTNLAIELISNIHYSNKNLSHKEILERVKEGLRDVRFFDNLSGYFFIYDLEGYNVLLPTIPEMENTYMYNQRDLYGTPLIQDFVNIAKIDGENFYEWYWYKPNENVMKNKIGYIKLYEPLGILVGTAKYEEDILQKIKNEAKVFLDSTSFDDSSYVFAYDSEGNLLSKKENETQFEKGSFQASQVIRGSKIVPDGFFISHTTSMSFDASPALQFNSSFVKYIPNLDIVIGINTYGVDILKSIKLKEKELQKNLKETLYDMTIVTFFVVVLILLIMLNISARLRRILHYYQAKLILRHNKTKEQKKLLEYQVNHDALTSLPNRTLLAERLRQLIKRANREEYQLAVIFIDVDKFKSINDTYGHHIGDSILKKVSKRFMATVRQTDIVARLSGDEFIIVLDKCKDINDIHNAINKLQMLFKKPFWIEKTEHHIKLSMGVSVYPNDGKNVGVLMKNADTAMLKAKEEGRDTYKFFTKEMDEEIQKYLVLEKELQEALKNDEFVLYYQPIVNSITSKIEGAEALIRWKHPIRGLIFPNDFISVAEESNLIIEIGNWVTKEAMRQVAAWYEAGLNPGRVSVNFAGKQLERDDLYEFILETLAQTHCKPEWLGVEIVERFIMKNPDKCIMLLKKLRDINIGISIDDFGTGHSSLAYLKQLPITKLKIDRTFVKNISESFEDRAIAKTIIALGSGLFLKVLAEGVETSEQRDFLIQNGCTQMQGYLFGKAVSASELQTLLENEKK
jgi:diguanylate cyclase (GGDEF)-like protein